jgi:hypothetical protein
MWNKEKIKKEEGKNVFEGKIKLIFYKIAYV